MEITANSQKPIEYTQKYRLSLFDKSRPVKVATFYEDRGKAPELYPSVLSKIIHNGSAQSLPVFVVSVNGLKRSGKSFLLNLIENYLNYTVEHFSDGLDWKDYKTSVKHGNFKQSGEPVTYGLWIWDHPFIVGSPGNEVAILLMDCQGLGDGLRSDPDLENVIVYTALELSSMVIWNSREHFDSTSLDKLKLCTDIATLQEKNLQEKVPIFESLVFVTRDWQAGGELGARPDILKTQLETSKSELMQKVTRGIQYAFAKIDCVVLPHPGGAVISASDEDEPALKVGDMSESFVTNTRKLCQMVMERSAARDQLMLGRDFKKKFKALHAQMQVMEQRDLLLHNSSHVVENTIIAKATKVAQSHYEEGLLKLANSTDPMTDNELMAAVKKRAKEAQKNFNVHTTKSGYADVYKDALRSLLESHMVDFHLVSMSRRTGEYADFDHTKAKEFDAKIQNYLTRNRGVSGVLPKPDWYKRYMLSKGKKFWRAIERFFVSFGEGVLRFFDKLEHAG